MAVHQITRPVRTVSQRPPPPVKRAVVIQSIRPVCTRDGPGRGGRRRRLSSWLSPPPTALRRVSVTSRRKPPPNAFRRNHLSLFGILAPQGRIHMLVSRLRFSKIEKGSRRGNGGYCHIRQMTTSRIRTGRTYVIASAAKIYFPSVVYSLHGINIDRNDRYATDGLTTVMNRFVEGGSAAAADR
ncbi:hypothetical protein EVAR_37007_1 [Eumeta japonica]|uniref:Uncharacterized protein n=1 Tax=Eumeta variegata TaxID=151549 RepID=A0A4C1WZF0_EUMVA|nr:hypothetical protein EVAR_37007_1 [Eumeta japonica]